MSAKRFLDTNIFVYSFDESVAAKKAKAIDLIDAALHQHSAIISTQVMQEFLNVALKKFDPALSLSLIHILPI